MVSPMVASWRRVIVVPLLVVDRDSHLCWVAMVQTVRTAEVLIAPIVVWVGDVRIVIEAAKVLRSLPVTPTCSITFFLCLAGLT